MDRGIEKDYEDLIRAITDWSKRAMQLYSPNKALLLFTDASSNYWSFIIMHDEHENVSRDVMKLKPQPFIFASGKFAKNQLKWHISQKELFSIIHAFKRFRYLLMTHNHPVFVYTDHANLVPLLRPNWN